MCALNSNQGEVRWGSRRRELGFVGIICKYREVGDNVTDRKSLG